MLSSYDTFIMDSMTNTMTPKRMYHPGKYTSRIGRTYSGAMSSVSQRLASQSMCQSREPALDGLPPVEMQGDTAHGVGKGSDDADGHGAAVSYTHLRAHETVLDLVC